MQWEVIAINSLNDTNTDAKNSTEEEQDLVGRRLEETTGKVEPVNATGTVEINKLFLKANFTSPALVSRDQKDRIVIEVQVEMFDLEPDFDVEFFELEQNFVEYKAIHKIEPYYAGKNKDEYSQLAQQAENALIAFFSANLVLSFFTAGLLQYLWGLINTLQLIMLTALFDVQMPENAEMIMFMFLKLCSLDFIESEWIL